LLSRLGILLTSAGCGLLCAAWAMRLSARAKALQGWIRALAVLESLPLCSGEGMCGMLEKAAQTARCISVETALKQCAEEMKTDRLASLSEAMERQKMEGMKAEDLAALHPVWKALEQADARTVSAAIKSAGSRMKDLSREAEEDLHRDGKLALSLCPMAAAAAFLAML